jgi:hypothetical protein
MVAVSRKHPFDGYGSANMPKKMRLLNSAHTAPLLEILVRRRKPPRRAPPWTYLLLAYLDADKVFPTSAFPELCLTFESKECFVVTLEGVTGIFAYCGCPDLCFEVVQQGTRSGIQLKSDSPIYEAKSYFQYPDVFWKWIEMKPIPDVMPARLENCATPS